MVYKVLIALMLLAGTAKADVTLSWTETKTPACQKLVARMLGELRAMANDVVIDFTVDPKQSADVHVACKAAVEPAIIELSDADETFALHDRGSIAGFDALDWVPFQKKHLHAGVDLAPKTPDENQVRETQISAVEKTEAETKSAAKRTLFMAAMGGAGGALGGALLSPNPENRVMNTAVFGLTGAVVGGIIGAIWDNQVDRAAH